MKTSKPVCGITYNTPAFLRSVLESLKAAGRISQAYWVFHQPDVDCRKEHCHLLLFTTAAVDPWAIATAFDEADNAVGKPRRFLPNPETQGRCLSVPDWMWYGIHDADYLAAHGMTRNIHYDRDAVQALDADELEARWVSLPPVRLGREAVAAKGIRLAMEGKTWSQIVLALGSELSRDPYLLGFLSQAVVAAYHNREDAAALVERLSPPPAPPKGRKGRQKSRNRPFPEEPPPGDDVPPEFDLSIDLNEEEWNP